MPTNASTTTASTATASAPATHWRMTHWGRHRVLFVMALDAEYGPCLQALIQPLMTGVGPVEAAVSLTRVLTELHLREALPHWVVSLGSAGSARLHKTQVYQASSVSYRDMDASALGFARGVTPFLDLPPEVALPLHILGMASARLSTGANVVSGAAYADIDADMVDMETFAVLRACQTFGLPLVALRGISDGDAELSQVSDWTEHLHQVDRHLAEACTLLRECLLHTGT